MIWGIYDIYGNSRKRAQHATILVILEFVDLIHINKVSLP